jgi:hypothetical protein
MEPQTVCEHTTDESIQNTSLDPNAQQGSEPPISEKPMNSEQSTDRGAGKSSQYFSLLDLCRLTFSLDGREVLNAQDATNEQFGALADVVADVTNVEQWYLEERRDFMNGLRAFCEERNYPFPFTIVDEESKPTTPRVYPTQEVSSPDVNAQKSAEEGPGDALAH